jgi:hypothetical protein
MSSTYHETQTSLPSIDFLPPEILAIADSIVLTLARYELHEAFECEDFSERSSRSASGW